MAHTGLQPLCLFLAVFPTLLCVIIVGIRIWTRSRQKILGLDDVLLVIATFLNGVLSFTTCGYIFAGYWGYHIYDVPEGAIDTVLVLKWNYANAVIYNPILALIKASFLWTLIKLRSPNHHINRCLWATLLVNGCFAIAAPLVCAFQCRPVARYWDKSIPGKCANVGAYTVSTASIVLATDILILLMPTWILHDLKMPFGRKLMVIAFLSFGVAVTVVGAVRTSVLIKIFVIGKVGPDPTYDVGLTLSNIESSLGIIGCCGPTIKYLLSFCFPALKSTDGSSNRGYTYPPTDGSHGASRSRRYARGSRIPDDSKGTEGSSRAKRRTFSEDMEFELGNVDGQHSGGARADSDEQLVITKTVAWTVDASQSDWSSAHERNASTPHAML